MHINISNTYTCFVRLWQESERTRLTLANRQRRYCLRNVLKVWFGDEATADYIWEVCTKCGRLGWDELPPPTSDPRSYREFLRAAVSARLGIGMRQVNLAALDNAFAAVFPECTPLNVNKKRRSDIRQ